VTLAIAVLSLTRDRLDYTKHCFRTLREMAGCEFDHYVFDNGSTDGTQDWLRWEYNPEHLILSPENIGVCRGLNAMLDAAFEIEDYDVIVKFDNDCELTQHKTLATVARLTDQGGCLLSPRILGLRQPPQPTRELRIGEETILDVPQIGGIFLASPSWVFQEFRYNENNPLYGRDDVDLCWWFREQGGTCGYVKRFEAWHYETTDGQEARYPEYWSRKMAEMEAA